MPQNEVRWATNKNDAHTIKINQFYLKLNKT